jgi:cell division septation protein DedD
MPGYQSQESAQAELKALQLLGFRTKDAEITKDPKGTGYVIVLSTMKSKNSAQDMVENLSRMSFRATVEVVQR